MAGLVSQRMLLQLGRMGRDGAATGPLSAFMLLIHVGSHQPQCPPLPTLFIGVLGVREAGGGLFSMFLEIEPAFVTLTKLDRKTTAATTAALLIFALLVATCGNELMQTLLRSTQ